MRVIDRSFGDPGRGRTGRWGRVLMLAGLLTFILGGPASAQGLSAEELQDIDALSAELQAELESMLDLGTGDIVGCEGKTPPCEPGVYDLPPGEIVSGTLTAIPFDSLEDDGTSQLSGPCMGIAMSFGPDDNGDGSPDLIDMMADFNDSAPPIDMVGDVEPGTFAMTASNPFKVHVDGTVAFAGIAGGPGAGPQNHTWFVAVQGLNLDSGGDPNELGENRNAGSIDLGEQLPAAAKVSALFQVTGEMVADGGFACSGEGFVKSVGGTPVLGGTGLILTLAAGLGGLFNARPVKSWSG